MSICAANTLLSTTVTSGAHLFLCFQGRATEVTVSWCLQDFAALQVDEMTAGIQSRRTKIFLLMEEVRRLRIQERLKVGDFCYR